MAKKTAPITIPKKQRGRLVCSRCDISVEFHSYAQGPERDGGWPMHRCKFEVRPFAKWTPIEPIPPNPPSPLETTE